MEQKINGIHCGVDTCVYNHNKSECTAGKVDISCTCSKADCSDETECKTFKSRG